MNLRKRHTRKLRSRTTGTRPALAAPILLLQLFSAPVLADDTQIYLTEPATPVASSILFILDESEDMTATALRSLQSAFSIDDGILNKTSVSNFDIAVMAYSSDSLLIPGAEDTARIRVLADFTAIRNPGKNNSGGIASAIQKLSPEGDSPVVTSLNMGARWFRQNIVELLPASPREFFSPLKAVQNDAENNHCRPNAMVLVSAGPPDSTTAAMPTKYRGLACDTSAPFSSDNNKPGLCAQEIVATAYAEDMMPESQFPGWSGSQNLITYTAGIQIPGASETETFLQNIAYRGGGRYASSMTSQPLPESLMSIINEVSQSVRYDYTAPTIPFRPDQVAISGSFIYIPVFTPAASLFWTGKLLKFRTGLDKSGRRFIKDKNNKDVLNNSLQFNAGVEDYWQASDAGNNTERQVFTWIQGEDKDLTALPQGSTISPNRVHTENTRVSAAMLGVFTPLQRQKLLDWLNGTVPPQKQQKNTTHNGVITSNMPTGAALHSTPVVVKYPNQNEVVLLNSTDGMLHAFNAGGTTAGGGEEIWAFMPQQLLSDLSRIKRNPPSSIPYYGLDGPMIVFDLAINGQSKKLAVFGMRRGGKSLYALDISKRKAPKLAWQITGGTSPGFENLGQTWSTPRFARMELNGGATREVLVFGGGYDPGQDSTTSRSDDDYGNAIYIIDASTGELLACFSSDTCNSSPVKLQLDNMKNGIIGIFTADMNGNGITDRVYATGVGGRVFRIDVPDREFTDTRISGGMIADINVDSGDYRRFFNPPELAYYSRGGNRFLAILIGSGFRPQPLNNSTVERFYMIKDLAITAAPVNLSGDIEYPAVTEGMLYDASDNLIQTGDVNQIEQERRALSNKQGWYIDLLEKGVKQKAFTPAVVFGSVISFTVFQGNRTDSKDVCTASSSMGSNRLYAIRLLDGAAAMDMNKDRNIGTEDRSKKLITTGIPPTALIIPRRNEEDDPTADPDNAIQLPDRFHTLSWEEIIDQYPAEDDKN